MDMIQSCTRIYNLANTHLSCDFYNIYILYNPYIFYFYHKIILITLIITIIIIIINIEIEERELFAARLLQINYRGNGIK